MKKKQQKTPFWINPFFLGALLVLTLLFFDLLNYVPRILQRLK